MVSYMGVGGGGGSGRGRVSQKGWTDAILEDEIV